ncbi:methyltransferase domain-containing protein [Spirillospora sp. NPDC050679]
MEAAADFCDVDATGHAPSFLEYLERVENYPAMRELRERTYRLLTEPLAGRPQARGVDVGCGPGRAVADLAAMGWQAGGVDLSHAMVQAARARYRDLDIWQADATALPFADGSLVWYRAERVYMHLPDPAAALHEARRVLAPQGVILLADSAFDSTVTTTAFPALTRTIMGAFTDSLANGQAATNAAGLLTQTGFTAVTTRPHPVFFDDLSQAGPALFTPAVTAALDSGAITDAQAARWQDDLAERAAQGRFLGSMTVFITTARAT